MNSTVGAKGSVFYGLHFCPGVAEYTEPNKDTFRIFLNEDTIRRMSQTFAGRPVFVEHVDEVDDNLAQVKNEADGWVIDSFYNASDGKTWAKFIVVTDRGLAAIKNGWRLSNAYIPKAFGQGGVWNGVDYQKEVIDGEFEHLAIVKNPRYDESVIYTPEQFKAYNDKKTIELKSIANSKGEPKMKFFKKQKVENAIDLEGTIVELPKSKKEMALGEIVNAYDAVLNLAGYAAPEHMVKVNDKEEMSVADLVKAHQAKCNEVEEMMKKKSENEVEGEPGADMDMDNESLDIDQMGEVDRGGDVSEGRKNEEDEEEMKKKNAEKMEKDCMPNKKKNEKATALKNANKRIFEGQAPRIDLSMDQVARGKARYGSGK